MEYSLLIIFFYGVIHALAPDHLSAIALFSIGKKKKETLILSLLFAIGHGFTLYLLALIIDKITNDSLLEYGDTISSAVILLMGLYLVYLAITNKIRVDRHSHDDEDDKHLHVYYKNEHLHDKGVLVSLGLLMGIGGIRGMLVTVGVVANQQVSMLLVLSFIAGVSLIFLIFGYLIYLINSRMIGSMNSLRYATMSIGLFSIALGVYKLSELTTTIT